MRRMLSIVACVVLMAQASFLSSLSFGAKMKDEYRESSFASAENVRAAGADSDSLYFKTKCHLLRNSWLTAWFWYEISFYSGQDGECAERTFVYPFNRDGWNIKLTG